MPTDAKDLKPSEPVRAERQAMVTHSLQDCWQEPVDTFITEDIPLLLTKLSMIPPVPERKG